MQSDGRSIFFQYSCLFSSVLAELASFMFALNFLFYQDERGSDFCIYRDFHLKLPPELSLSFPVDETRSIVGPCT